MESLQEMQAWERTGAQRLADQHLRATAERAHGDAEIERLGRDAATILVRMRTPLEPAVSVQISHLVAGTRRHRIVNGPAGWTLPGTGFGVSTDGRLHQVWSMLEWRTARCWHPSQGHESSFGRPKLALWPHHDRVCLDHRHAFRPFEEVVAEGVSRLLPATTLDGMPGSGSREPTQELVSPPTFVG
jgi:hypothetical protein